MEKDQQYQKVLKKSYIMQNYHQKHPNAEIPLVPKQHKLIHTILSNGIFNTLIHFVLYPLDTIKNRKISVNNLDDAAKFIKNNARQLSTYRGLYYGWVSNIFGGICFLALRQQNFYGAVLFEGFIKTYIDINKISLQMGNKQIDWIILKKIYAKAVFFGVLRDIIARSSFTAIISRQSKENSIYNKKNKQALRSIYIGASLVATVISHPFDVMFTKIASQRILKYTGLIQTPKLIFHEQSLYHFSAGLPLRILYTFISNMLFFSHYQYVYNSIFEAF